MHVYLPLASHAEAVSNGDEPRGKSRQIGLESPERFRSLGNPGHRLYLTVMFKTYAEHREDFLAIHRQGSHGCCVMPLKRRLAFLR